MALPASSPSVSALIAHLQSLTAGLLFVSESDAPLEVIRCAYPADPLPNASLLQLLGEPVQAPVQVVTLAHFLRNHTAATGTPADQQIAARYQALQSFMELHLAQVQVYRVGSEPRLQAYALGEAEAGQLVGFKTVLVET